MKVNLLDCTLRDGGFVNDWNFGFLAVKGIISLLVNSNIDIVELGFLDNRVPLDENRTISPSFSQFDSFCSGIEKSKSKYVLMIDYGTFDLSDIPLKENTLIDGIRVIFKKTNCQEAVEYCRQIVAKGYMVFVQPVSITGYSDIELLNLVNMINEIKPYCMSIVDTYGLMHKKDLIRYCSLLDNNLNKNIQIGYHTHNNFQLSYANIIEFIDLITDRTVTVDASLYGMGKGAGNANTELVAMYLNENREARYNVSQIMEIIDTQIMKIYSKHFWGYSIKFFLAACNDCHPNYVDFFLKLNTVTVYDINEILKEIPQQFKLTFNNEVANNLYLEYQQKNSIGNRDYNAIKGILSDRKLLVLFPGNSIVKEHKKIQSYIENENPLIISVNFIPKSFSAEMLFVGNLKRFNQMTELKSSHQLKHIIATSNLHSQLGNNDAYFIDYKTLLDKESDIIDSSGLMLLRLLIMNNVKNVAVAGFDGFHANMKDNYFDNSYEQTDENKNISQRTLYISQQLKIIKNNLIIKFITTSLYDEDKNNGL